MAETVKPHKRYWLITTVRNKTTGPEYATSVIAVHPARMLAVGEKLRVPEQDRYRRELVFACQITKEEAAELELLGY